MNLSELLPTLIPEAVLLVTALGVVAMSMLPGMTGNHAWPLRLAAVIGVLAAAAATQSGWGSPDGAGPLVWMDPWARWSRLWILILAAPALLIPPGKCPLPNPGEFLALILFSLIGLCLAVAANHLLLLFVALELAGLSFYLLAAWPRTREAASSGIRYFLFGASSAALFLFGCSLVFSASPDLTLDGIRSALADGPMSWPAALGFLMMILGIAFKLAAAPMHAWAPEVYQKSPAGLVVVIAGASKLAATVVLARLCLLAFPALAGSAAWGNWQAGWALWLAVLAVISMVAGNMLALGQSSVRRLLACSAIANAGYALVGFSSGGAEAMAMAIFHMAIYGLATAGALAITAEVENDTGSEHRDAFRGLARRAPWQAAAMVVFLGSLASLPPMAGFFGKFSLFATALKDGGPGMAWIVGLGVLMSAISLYYYLSVLRRVFETGPDETPPAACRLPDAALWPAIAVLGIGLLPPVLLTPLLRAVAISLEMVFSTGLP